MIRKLSIIIPAFNEERSIDELLQRVVDVKLNSDIQKEILIINDCSTDGTDEVINEFILSHPKVEINYQQHISNQGKGAAIHTGIKKSTGDYIIIQDADLEYDPEEYNLLLEPILRQKADVVFGSRFIGGKPHRILFFGHTFGNKMLTFLCNLFLNLDITDLHTCYKVFKAEILQSIQLKEKGFEFDPEVTCKIARIRDIRIYEVAISYSGRTYKEGKKIRWQHAFSAVYCLIKYGLLRIT